MNQMQETECEPSAVQVRSVVEQVERATGERITEQDVRDIAAERPLAEPLEPHIAEAAFRALSPMGF